MPNAELSTHWILSATRDLCDASPHTPQVRFRFPHGELTGQYLSGAPGISTADHCDPVITRGNHVSLKHFVLMFRNLRAIRMRVPGYDWS